MSFPPRPSTASQPISSTLSVRFAINYGFQASFAWFLHSLSESLRGLRISRDHSLDVQSELIPTLALVGGGITDLTFAESISHGVSFPSVISSCPNLIHLSFDPNPLSSELRKCLSILPTTLRNLRLSYAGPQFRTVEGRSRMVLGSDVHALRKSRALDHLKELAIEVDPFNKYIGVPVQELNALQETRESKGVIYLGPDLVELVSRTFM